MAALWKCEGLCLEVLSKPQQIFTYFSKNRYKNTQTGCKVFSNLTNVLQQLTFIVLVSFLLTLNIIHTLLQRYYLNFEKVNVDWKSVLNFLSE